MISSLEDYTSFLCRHSMSAEQFLFCCIIYEGNFPLIYKMFNERNGGFDLDEIRDLEDRGYIINENVGDNVMCDHYKVTPKFVDEIYGEEDTIWKELTETYPKFIFIDSKKIPAQSCDLDALRTTYISKVKRKLPLHKKIMKALRYAIDHDMISMGIEKWVRGEQWKTIEEDEKEKPAVNYGEREL